MDEKQRLLKELIEAVDRKEKETAPPKEKSEEALETENRLRREQRRLEELFRR
jgi:hypothetical protein